MTSQPANLPLVTVIMPVRNEARFIERTVGAVLSQDYPAERLEIIVIDGMSEDKTRDMLTEMQQQHTNLRWIDNPLKIVPPALNIALAQATGDIILRVDGHTIIPLNYVSTCVEVLARGTADCVGGPVETVCQTAQSEAIALAMSVPFGVGDATFRTGLKTEKFVDTLAFGAYKREVIELAGPFDEELIRNQDAEYNYRLRKLGAKLLLVPSIPSKYYSRSTIRGLWRQYFWTGFWKVRVLQKHPLQMKVRQFIPPAFVGVLLAGALLAPFLEAGRRFFAAFATFYLGVTLLASFYTAAKAKKWSFLPMLPPAFMTMHISYGLGFLWGLVRFARRWKSQTPAEEQAAAQAAAKSV